MWERDPCLFHVMAGRSMESKCGGCSSLRCAWNIVRPQFCSYAKLFSCCQRCLWRSCRHEVWGRFLRVDCGKSLNETVFLSKRIDTTFPGSYERQWELCHRRRRMGVNGNDFAINGLLCTDIRSLYRESNDGRECPKFGCVGLAEVEITDEAMVVDPSRRPLVCIVTLMMLCAVGMEIFHSISRHECHEEHPCKKSVYVFLLFHHSLYLGFAILRTITGMPQFVLKPVIVLQK